MVPKEVPFLGNPSESRAFPYEGKYNFPNVSFGKPCIEGHRIWVSLVLDWLAGGMTIREILDEYPGLEEADIYACLAFGADRVQP